MSERTYDVLDRPEVTNVLFHPRREGGVPMLVAGVHNVRVPVADGVAVGGKIYTGRDGAPTILYFHGNGEIASDYDTIAPLYQRHGLTLFVIDYRGYGASDGRPSASTLIADARASLDAAADILRERGVNTGPLVVMGRSLGSAAALEIVDHAAEQVAGLILESPFANTLALVERIGFVRMADADEARDGFGNLEKIARCALPTLIIHGEDDWIIPVADGIDLYEASAATDKELIKVPNAGHNDLMMVGQDRYFGSIAAFCAKVAGTA